MIVRRRSWPRAFASHFARNKHHFRQYKRADRRSRSKTLSSCKRRKSASAENRNFNLTLRLCRRWPTARRPESQRDRLQKAKSSIRRTTKKRRLTFVAFHRQHSGKIGDGRLNGNRIEKRRGKCSGARGTWAPAANIYACSRRPSRRSSRSQSIGPERLKARALAAVDSPTRRGVDSLSGHDDEHKHRPTPSASRAHTPPTTHSAGSKHSGTPSSDAVRGASPPSMARAATAAATAAAAVSATSVAIKSRLLSISSRLAARGGSDDGDARARRSPIAFSVVAPASIAPTSEIAARDCARGAERAKVLFC